MLILFYMPLFLILMAVLNVLSNSEIHGEKDNQKADGVIMIKIGT